jgi:hypothetical protein
MMHRSLISAILIMVNKNLPRKRKPSGFEANRRACVWPSLIEAGDHFINDIFFVSLKLAACIL